MQPQASVPVRFEQGHAQWGVPRTWTDDDVPHVVAHQFVHDDHGLCGRRIHSHILANVADNVVSELFDPQVWREVPGFDFTDITYHRAVDSGTVRIAFDRP